MGNKTLVTCGYGLVGSEFNSLNYIPLSSSEADLRVRSEVDNVLEKINFDSIIHCAGKVGGVGGNMLYKGDFFYDNIMINTNVSVSYSGYQQHIDNINRLNNSKNCQILGLKFPSSLARSSLF